ncbi:MAG: hypothetical protein FWF92_08540 [Oscillospiraceae bacterium]|nr:hypothetical protein [Oscillospiraceae bacterium]
MKKIKNFKLFAGIVLFAKAFMLLTVMIVLSIQKKSIPRAIIAVFTAVSVTSALLLISYRQEELKCKKLREMDAFYDYDYESAYNGLDDDDEEEDFGLGLDEHLNAIN